MKNAIYVASSWRNHYQPDVVEALRAHGHDVYNFRNPVPGDSGFSWSQITDKPRPWPASVLTTVLGHPIAKDGFNKDADALIECDACLLVLPCGRSAHVELGFAAGLRKYTAVLMLGEEEPELMYRLTGPILGSIDEAVLWARDVARVFA